MLAVRLLHRSRFRSHIPLINDTGVQRVFVAQAVARELGVSPGELLVVRVARGQVEVLIAAAYEDLSTGARSAWTRQRWPSCAVLTGRDLPRQSPVKIAVVLMDGSPNLHGEESASFASSYVA